MNSRKYNDPYTRFKNNDNVLSLKNDTDKSISIDFFSIVLSGDITKLDQFITNNNFNINSLNKEGINALHLILNTDLSELDKLNIIKYLINKKILIENKNKMGETPLHVATKKNLKSIIIELINNGANIQSSDSLEITPLHYLGRGLVVDCGDSFVENIIDDPKPKFDKKVISKMAEKVRDFYDSYLLNDWADLESIENALIGPMTSTATPTATAFVSGSKPYKNRLINFFKHIKNAAKKIIEENESFNYDSTQIANDIKKIATDVTLSDEEKKLQNEKIRTDYYNKVYKIIQRNDVRFDKNIDLTTTIHLDEYGLNLANKNSAYSISQFSKNNYSYNIDEAFYKVNDEPTLNQNIYNNILENGKQLLELKKNFGNDLSKLHNEIGTGVIETCKDLASFIYTINFYNQIYELNEYMSNFNFGTQPIPSNTMPSNIVPSNTMPSNIILNFIDESIYIAKNDIQGINFRKKYFMEYNNNTNNLNINPNTYPNTNPPSTIPNGEYQFNQNVLTNKFDFNKITSKNIIANENEILINLNNFDWNNNLSNINKVLNLLSEFELNPMKLIRKSLELPRTDLPQRPNIIRQRALNNPNRPQIPRWNNYPIDLDVINRFIEYKFFYTTDVYHQIVNLNYNFNIPSINVTNRVFSQELLIKNIVLIIRIRIEQIIRYDINNLVGSKDLNNLFSYLFNQSIVPFRNVVFDEIFIFRNVPPGLKDLIIDYLFEFIYNTINKVICNEFNDLPAMGRNVPLTNDDYYIFTLGVHNKITDIKTYISKNNFYYVEDENGKISKNNIIIDKENKFIFDDRNHISYNKIDNYILSKNKSVKKLLRFRISKKKKNNKINLFLDYISFDDTTNTINFNDGQFEIKFILSRSANFNSNNLQNLILKSFDLFDFGENEITFQNIYGGNNDNQFIFTPILAIINKIKDSDIIKQMNEKTDFIDSDFGVNDNINKFCNLLHKSYIRYYETLNRYSKEFIRDKSIENKVRNMTDNLNFINNLKIPLYNNMYENLLNNKVELLEKIDVEISNVRNLIERIINKIKEFINMIEKRFDYFLIYQYFNSQNNLINLQYNIKANDSFIELDSNHFEFVEGQNVPPNEYFTKYNNLLEIKQPTNDLNIKNIGIEFVNYDLLPTGTPTVIPNIQRFFTDVIYDTTILNGYFYLTRYRMIEEIVLDFHFESENNISKKEIYNYVKKYVNDNLGQIDPLMERPLILSIIGDLIDNHLISNVKKALFDAVTEIVNKKIVPNIGTGTQTEISLIVQSTNPVNATGNVEINYSAVDFDIEFGLNLSEQDDLVEKALNKINNINLDKLLDLSFGDMLLSNKIKYKKEIGEKSNEIVEQLFYPSDFLSSINSSQKCVIYDNDIINLIDNKILNFNKKDYYGNSVIYYAINSQNYLFLDWLIDKDDKCIEVINKNNQSPFIYILEKLKSICEYFGKDNNILNEINKYYTISLKEEVIKLDIHGNIMKNLDMLVLLYLFLINSSFFNEMFNKDYNLLNLLKEIYNDKELKIDDSSYQKDFKLIFRNPIHNIFLEKTFDGEQFKFDVILNLKNKLEKESNDNQEKIKYLESKIANYTSIQSLLMPTDISYFTNIEENKNKVNNKIISLQTDIAKIQEKMTKINNMSTDIELNDNFSKKNLGFSNTFDQIFEISKFYNDNESKDFNFSQFLKGLRQICDSPEFSNNTYFFHNLISKFIIKFIQYCEKVLNQPYLKIDELEKLKEKLNKLIEIMKKTMYKKIFYKKNNVKNIDKNEHIEKEFYRICFTIDIVVGNIFYKVLKRLIMTFLKSRYQVSKNNTDKFLKFVRQKADNILLKINKYIQPDILLNKYEPSELTKKMVLLISGYKSSKNLYSNSNENDFFEYIISSIKNNGFEVINDNEPLLKYLDKIFMPYFIDYYRICITKLINVTNSYENYILNKYYNLNMLKLLIDKKINNSAKS